MSTHECYIKQFIYTMRSKIGIIACKYIVVVVDSKNIFSIEKVSYRSHALYYGLLCLHTLMDEFRRELRVYI